MLNILNTHTCTHHKANQNTHITKAKQTKQRARAETSGGDGYIYHLDCVDGSVDVYLCPSSSNCMY